MMKWLDQEYIDKFIIVTSLMSGISAFIAPVVIVQLIQEFIHFSYDNWFFTTPRLAYQTVMIVMISIPILALAYFILRSIIDKKGSSLKTGWLFLMIVFFLFIAASAGVNHYYYVDENGLHYNSLTNIKETTILWEDIDQVEPVSVKEGNRLMFYYVLTSVTGDDVTMQGNDEFYRYRQDIYDKVEQHGGTILDRKERKE